MDEKIRGLIANPKLYERLLPEDFEEGIQTMKSLRSAQEGKVAVDGGEVGEVRVAAYVMCVRPADVLCWCASLFPCRS